MSDFPDYYPEFMRDFHDQKDLFKAFYTWRLMMDNKNGSDLAQMANFRELQCLFVSMLDFLFAHGWQLYRTRKSGEYADIQRTVSSLNDLQAAWWSLLEDRDGLRMRDEVIQEYMGRWNSWLPYMPDEVQAAWENLNDQ